MTCLLACFLLPLPLCSQVQYTPILVFCQGGLRHVTCLVDAEQYLHMQCRAVSVSSRLVLVCLSVQACALWSSIALYLQAANCGCVGDLPCGAEGCVALWRCVQMIGFGYASVVYATVWTYDCVYNCVAIRLYMPMCIQTIVYTNAWTYDCVCKCIDTKKAPTIAGRGCLVRCDLPIAHPYVANVMQFAQWNG